MTHRRFRAALPALALALLVLPAAPAGLAAQEPLWGGELVEKIDSLAAVVLESGPVAGLGVAVRKGDDVLLATGYGMADLENRVPANAETVFRIGSITKQFTAAAIMQLVEAGEIGLEDSMTEYLPDFDTQGHEVTVRHLLTHTSGITSYTGLEEWRPQNILPLSDEELVAIFEDEPFDFAPGEAYRYSNSGYYLLGMIVEAASGLTYREYVAERLFAPLGMDASYYCDERPLIPNRAEGYMVLDGELVNDDYLSMNQPGAAGALCSTVLDLLSWAAALRSGRVVSPEGYQLMTTPAALTDGSPVAYGFGLVPDDLEGHARVSHGGGINGFSTQHAYFPDEDLDVVVFVNTSSPWAGRAAETISRWALGLEVIVVRDLDLDDADFATYVGTYRLREGFDLRVFRAGNRLMSQATGQGTIRLRAQGEHVFVPTFDDRVRIVFTVEDGLATALTLHQGGRTFEAPRVEEDGG